MRIAYLINQYPKTSHTFIRREIAALERLGITVERWSVRRPKEPLVDPADVAESQRTRVILPSGLLATLAAVLRQCLLAPRASWRALRLATQLGRRSQRGVLRHWAYWAEAAVVKRLCAQQRIEHLHAHFGSNPACVAMLAREMGGVPYSFTAHGVESFDAPPLVGMSSKVALAKCAIAVSHFGKSQLQRWSEPRHWDKIHVVHCGLARAEIEAQPIEPRPEGRLLCVARLAPEKGVSVLLHALARLRSMGLRFELDIVGDGPMRPALEELARGLGLDSSVHFLGWQAGDAVRRHLAAARLLVLPSLAEGLPMVIVEALAMGRPVVASCVAGIPEIVEPQRTGWLFSAGSVTELSAALRSALEIGADELEAMGRRGRQRVLEQHDLDREVGRLAQWLRAPAAAEPIAD